MNILITAGSTLDFIDSIHYVSNINDGAIAAGIGEELSKQPEIDQIFYICGKRTKYPWQHQTSNDQKFFLDEWLDKIAIYPVDDIDDLEKSVDEIFTKFEIDTVIHLMNIVNYGDSKVHLLNNKKDAANLIEYLAKDFNLDIEIKNDLTNVFPSEKEEQRIISGYEKLFIEQSPTKKILRTFKNYKPDVKIISSKIESGVSSERLTQDALRSIKNNNSDLVLALDIEENSKESESVVYLVKDDNNINKLKNVENISEHILDFINNK